MEESYKINGRQEKIVLETKKASIHSETDQLEWHQWDQWLTR